MVDVGPGCVVNRFGVAFSVLQCWHCTFRNEPDVTACEMCELVRDTSKEVVRDICAATLVTRQLGCNMSPKQNRIGPVVCARSSTAPTSRSVRFARLTRYVITPLVVFRGCTLAVKALWTPFITHLLCFAAPSPTCCYATGCVRGQ